jgi:hypothetical protein
MKIAFTNNEGNVEFIDLFLTWVSELLCSPLLPRNTGLCTEIHTNTLMLCQWQRPRCLRHDTSSPARTLESCVRIPLKAWISVCVYSVFVLSCVGYRPCVGLIPRSRSPTGCLRLRNWSETKCFTDALCSKWEQQEYTDNVICCSVWVCVLIPQPDGWIYI